MTVDAVRWYFWPCRFCEERGAAVDSYSEYKRPHAQRAPALSHSCRSDCAVDNYTTAAGKRPPVRPKSGDVAPDGARSSRGHGGFFGWGWLSAPHLPSRARKLCPAPAPSEGGAADRSEELPWRCFAATAASHFGREDGRQGTLVWARLSGHACLGTLRADSAACVPTGRRYTGARRPSGAQRPRTAPSCARPLFRTN